MRMVMLAATAAILVAAPAASQAPGAPLAPNEVLLEVDATGTTQARADTGTVSLQLNSKGRTEKEAREASDAAAARVRTILRNAGIDARDFTISPASDTSSLLMMDVPMTDLGSDAATEEPQQTVSRTVQIRLRDLSRWDKLREDLEQAGVSDSGTPYFGLTDEGPARLAAKLDALRRAQADAEAYAARLGMRVVRILKVSDRARTDFSELFTMENMMRAARDVGRGANTEIEVKVRVSVDYALAPSR